MVTLKVSEEDYMNVLIPENVVVALFLKPVGLKPMQKKSPEVRICCFDTCNKECKTGHTLPNSIAFCKNSVSKTSRPCRVESSHDSTLLLFLSHWSWGRGSIIVLNGLTVAVASFLASHTTFEKYYEIIPKYRSNFSHLYFETIIFSEKSYFFFGAAFFFLFFASLSFSSFSKSGGGL